MASRNPTRVNACVRVMPHAMAISIVPVEATDCKAERV